VQTGSINKDLSRIPTRGMFNDIFYEEQELNLRVLSKQLRAETEL
jgi:hypothetical protein